MCYSRMKEYLKGYIVNLNKIIHYQHKDNKNPVDGKDCYQVVFNEDFYY